MRTVITIIAVTCSTVPATAHWRWLPPSAVYERAFRQAEAVPASDERPCWQVIGKARGRALAVTARDFSPAKNGGRVGFGSHCAKAIWGLRRVCRVATGEVPCLDSLKEFDLDRAKEARR